MAENLKVDVIRKRKWGWGMEDVIEKRALLKNSLDPLIAEHISSLHDDAASLHHVYYSHARTHFKTELGVYFGSKD